MTNEQKELRHELVVGRCEGGKILLTKNAGLAIRKSAETFYSLKLHMFPGLTYFLSKNFGENPNYTIFSKIISDEGGVRFQNPVGAARLSNDMRTHLEIRFNLMDRRVCMSLFPTPGAHI